MDQVGQSDLAFILKAVKGAQGAKEILIGSKGARLFLQTSLYDEAC